METALGAWLGTRALPHFSPQSTVCALVNSAHLVTGQQGGVTRCSLPLPPPTLPPCTMQHLHPASHPASPAHFWLASDLMEIIVSSSVAIFIVLEMLAGFQGSICVTSCTIPFRLRDLNPASLSQNSGTWHRQEGWHTVSVLTVCWRPWQKRIHGPVVVGYRLL